MKIDALNDFAVLELDGQEDEVKTDAGIILQGQKNKVTYKSGKVLSTGSKLDAALIGKRVVVGKHVGIVINDSTIAVKGEDIVGVIKE